MSVLMYWVPVGALVIIAGIVAFTNISDAQSELQQSQPVICPEGHVFERGMFESGKCILGTTPTCPETHYFNGAHCLKR